VEGFINSGQGSTVIRLSRSSDLKDTTLRPEPGAQLNIEGDDGSSFPLFSNGNGEYTVSQLTLYDGVKYRLNIRTSDGKEYVSDYTPVKYTPPIDSITWQRENDGLRLYANAHDPQNDTKYYQWKYEETWEIHSSYYNQLEYIYDPVNTAPVAVTFKYPISMPIHQYINVGVLWLRHPSLWFYRKTDLKCRLSAGSVYRAPL
jgi:hypothetical protein